MFSCYAKNNVVQIYIQHKRRGCGSFSPYYFSPIFHKRDCSHSGGKGTYLNRNVEGFHLFIKMVWVLVKFLCVQNAGGLVSDGSENFYNNNLLLY